MISVYALWTFGLTFILWDPTPTAGQLWTLANEGLVVEEGKSVRCHTLRGLSRNQRSLCHRYNNHMAFVNAGAQRGLEECKFQMQSRRWNCTIPTNSSSVKALSVGSREVAFSYAITAAGVVHAIARACKNGELKSECGCSKHPRPDGLSDAWKWGGCGDDTDYAYGFSHEFIDAGEKENGSRDRRGGSRRYMNIHNNEAGRMSVVRATRPTCKCHGVSGSCSLKTCWMQAPDFREIGNKLQQKYFAAVEVRPASGGRWKPRLATASPPTITDLVYVDSSPDYCKSNPRMGVLGTKGRECNSDSTGMDGCGLMCCGRGYTTRLVEVTKTCHCKFQWCCFVRCQTCQETVRKSICN